MPNKLVVATTNQGKLKEIKSLLADLELPLDIGYLQDYDIASPEEPYEAFMENAIHKAKYYAARIGEATLSEDSGLCIEALDGFPGVRTKEFLEGCGSREAAFAKLEVMMKGSDNMRAHFNCMAALYAPTHDTLITGEARLEGTLTFPPKGNLGYAYQPIFIPEGYNKTLAELDPKEKRTITHRAIAIKTVLTKWRKLSPTMQE